jgi:hypothetical protein
LRQRHIEGSGYSDSDRKSGVRLFGEAVHRLSHAFEEECLGTCFAIVAVRKRDGFLSLGRGESGKEIGKG